MISNYEIGLGIENILDELKNAINKDKDLIDIKDHFGDKSTYKIYYSLENLLEDDTLKYHIFSNRIDSMEVDLEEYIVVAFDLNMPLLLKNIQCNLEILYFKNLIFMFELNTNDYFSFEGKDETMAYSDYNVPKKLSLENCVFSKTITFIFDWNKIELEGCIFLEDLYIYDLASEFKSYHCIFNIIFLENYEFNKLDVDLCTIKRLELYPDQQELDMECINIRNSEIEELVINADVYAKREFNNYDIEVSNIKVRDSGIRNIFCSNIQAKSMSFKRIYGEEFVIDRTMLNELTFKDLEYDNLLLTEVFINGRKVTQDDYKSIMFNNRKGYEVLAERLKGLFKMDDNPQARGFEFEKFLKDLFEINGLEPRESFKVEGEQIDGSFTLHNEIYLLEAKWTSKPIDKAALTIFNEKVSSKSGFTRGLFISYSGYSKDALSTFSSGREVKIVLMTVHELEKIIEEKKDFNKFLWDKVRALGEEGDFNKQILN